MKCNLITILKLSMIVYIRKYIICFLYLFLFSLCAFIGHEQNRVKGNIVIPIMKGIATSSVTTIFFTFYTLCFFMCQCVFENLYSRVQIDDDDTELKPIIIHSVKGPVMDDDIIDHTFFTKTVMVWYYVYSFGLSIFCASYCINASNLNASYFFCMGSVISSYIIFFKREKEETNGKRNSHFILILLLSLGCLYFFSFSIWFYNYHVFLFKPIYYKYENISTVITNKTMIIDETTFGRIQWRYLWLEVLGPLIAPFYIQSFKMNAKIHNFQRKGGDAYVIFCMPLLAFISTTFLTMYLSMDIYQHEVIDSPFITDFFEYEGGTILFAKFILINLIAAPFTIFTSLVVYVGAMGKREYSLICTSSQCMIFFLFSQVNIPKESINQNVVFPCCIMSFLCFMITILLLIINVYYKETELDCIVDNAISKCSNSPPNAI
jgi:hypothetical protein